MKKLVIQDIVSNEIYIKNRNILRSEMIALKKVRRIGLGHRLSLTFENRETVKYQIQEMMRVEHINDPKKIQFELDVYNEMIPEALTLSATLFIEVPDQNQIRAVLDTLQGLDKPETLYILVGGEKVFAEFEPGHSKEDRISAVHYLTFHFREEQARKFRDSQVEIHVEHPAYKASVALTQEQKQELAKDL
jgi:hypothetical protein